MGVIMKLRFHRGTVCHLSLRIVAILVVSIVLAERNGRVFADDRRSEHAAGCYEPNDSFGVVARQAYTKGDVDKPPLVPNRSEEIDSTRDRRIEPVPPSVLTFFGERFQRNLFYGKNELYRANTTDSGNRHLFVDWVSEVRPGSPRQVRYYINGVDFGVDEDASERLRKEIVKMPVGTFVSFPPQVGEKATLLELSGSEGVGKLLATEFAAGRLRRSAWPSSDERVGVGRVVWPGSLRELPDVVLTWTTPRFDAYTPPGNSEELERNARYYLNGRDMGVGNRGFDRVLGDLSTFPIGSHLMIYPFYASSYLSPTPLVRAYWKGTDGTAVPYHYRLPELRKVLLERQMTLTLVATPIRRLQTEVDRWLLAGGGPWHIRAITPFGVNLGGFFHLRLPDEETLWIPDVYPPVLPLISRPSSIPTPPSWIRYKPDRSRLKVFYQKECVYEAMRPEYCLSGVEGVESISVDMGGGVEGEYTVCLYFCDPNKDGMLNERVFSVALQGREVLSDFDVLAEAGSPFRPVVKQFSGVAIRDRLEISFRAKKGITTLCGFKIVRGKIRQQDDRLLDYRQFDFQPNLPRMYGLPRRGF